MRIIPKEVETLWTLFTAPVVWAAHFLVCYVLAAVWCAKRGKIKGDVRPIEQVWGFAREWYGRHCDPDWTKWTQEEAAEIFARHGLTGPIWELPTAQGRF